MIKTYFTSSNLIIYDYQLITYTWYKYAVQIPLINHLECYRQMASKSLLLSKNKEFSCLFIKCNLLKTIQQQYLPFINEIKEMIKIIVFHQRYVVASSKIVVPI